MKTLFEHIEHIQGKPHHVRKQIAFAAAGLGSALIALVWFAGSIATGAFALNGGSVALNADQGSSTTEASDIGGQVAGAAAAVSSPDAPAHIEIIDTSAPSVPAKKPSDQTILPF